MARARDTAREVFTEDPVDRDSSADPALLTPDASPTLDPDGSARAQELPELPFADQTEAAPREPADTDASPADPGQDRDAEAADSIRSIQLAREAADTKFETAAIGDAERAARVLREFQAASEKRREAAEVETEEKRADAEVDAKQNRERRFELARRSTKANVAEFLDITRRSVFDQVI